MAITLLEPLAAGNAIRVFITPATGAAYCRVLRRTADAFTGPDDAGAVVVADRFTDNVLLDETALVNGTEYFYRAYSWDGSAWDSPASVSGTPAASYQGDDVDAAEIVRLRLELGLAVEVARGALLPASGVIKVLRSPFMLAENVSFPMVYVHLDSFAPTDRAIGEMVIGPEHLPDGGWQDYEGFVARWAINIGGVSRNANERNDLRRALVRVLQANLPVFAGAGLGLVEFQFGDTEQLQENAAPLFMTGGTFGCISMSFVARGVPEITDVLVFPTYDGMEPSYE